MIKKRASISNFPFQLIYRISIEYLCNLTMHVRWETQLISETS